MIRSNDEKVFLISSEIFLGHLEPWVSLLLVCGLAVKLINVRDFFLLTKRSLSKNAIELLQYSKKTLRGGLTGKISNRFKKYENFADQFRTKTIFFGMYMQCSFSLSE